MASGDLTASTPTAAQGAAAIKTAVDALNLTATTDHIRIVPISGRDQQYFVFKVQREA